MEPNINAWIGLFVQVPLVGIFIWYSIKMQERFQQSLDKRDDQYEKRNGALVEAITANTQQLSELTREIISERQAANEPRTQPRRRGND
jgi:hypothetical protein